MYVIYIYIWIIYKFIIDEKICKIEKTKYMFLFALLIFFSKLNSNGQNVYQFLLVSLILCCFYPKKIIWYIGSVFFSFILEFFT